MTLRQWTNAYGGTYATMLLVAIGVSTVVTDELAGRSLWLHLLIGLPLLLAVQFTLSVIAWQFTKNRSEKLDEHDQAQEK